MTCAAESESGGARERQGCQARAVLYHTSNNKTRTNKPKLYYFKKLTFLKKKKLQIHYLKLNIYIILTLDRKDGLAKYIHFCNKNQY